VAKASRFLEVLAADEVEAIHRTAVRVLEEVGLWLPHQAVLETLHDAGARVDFSAQRALIQGHIIESAIRKFPHRFTWNARSSGNSLDMNGLDTYFSGPDSAINVIESDGTLRPGIHEDGERVSRLVDGLPNLSVATEGIHPRGLAGVALDAWHTMTVYVNSSKAMIGSSRSKASSEAIIRMAQVVGQSCGLPDGQLPLLALTNTVSPLYNTPDELAGMLEFIRHGLPLVISPEVQAGATGPATLAGVMAQATAEFLGHAVIAQLVHPGLPVMYGCVSSVFDMRKMMLPYGAPEADLLALATAQMARYYGIPSRGTGGASDANSLGMQAGVESLMSNLVCMLGGMTLVFHAAGEMQNTLAVSMEKIVADNEIIGMVKRLARGIEVTPESLGFDAIRDVGPRGHFLGSDHTLKHYRTEQFLPTVLDRDKFDLWQEAGGKRLEERARDQVAAILATHEPEALPREAERELRDIYAACTPRD
jgi:trimethylamine--corrinoid protein Co-methyltransferase